MEIKGKVAIVTGASGGIGLATVRLLTKMRVKVALVAVQCKQVLLMTKLDV